MEHEGFTTFSVAR